MRDGRQGALKRPPATPDNLHEMPRVVVATDVGGPEVLALVEQPIAAPGPDEVRIAVRGKLEVRARAFPLSDVGNAHREGQTGHVTGKLVLVPQLS